MTDSAFPRLRPHDPEFEYSTPGLTKREYAAIHIAAAIASRRVTFPDSRDAQEAVALADAVLREAGE